MKLLIVILCYRVPLLTIDCLRTLAPEIAAIPHARTVVVENGTGGDVPNTLRRAINEHGWGSWCQLLVLHTNLGFTGGNNVAIQSVMENYDEFEYVWLLNADTLVKPGAARVLTDFLDTHPRAGIAGSEMLTSTGEIMASPFRFMGIATELDRGLQFGPVSRLLRRWAVVPPTPKQPAAVDWVSGFSMLCRRTMLDQIGLLDEGLYTYFDDIDLCLRAHRSGWEVWYIPESRVVHLHGASTGMTVGSVKRIPPYYFEARRRFFVKSYGPWYTAMMDAAFITGLALWRVRRVLQRKPDTAAQYLLRDSIRHSIFRTGLALNTVTNPALKDSGEP